ncbi:hypothetical protein GCM10023075_21630 [Streptosporangium album]
MSADVLGAGGPTERDGARLVNDDMLHCDASLGNKNKSQVFALIAQIDKIYFLEWPDADRPLDKLRKSDAKVTVLLLCYQGRGCCWVIQ